MKSILKKRMEITAKDNRGLSLVEVLCAVAIFSLVAATIGTVIVISARTYNKGITETSLQQEAQLAANRISTIVQDANEAKFDPASKELTLTTNEKKVYTIRHDQPEAGKPGKLIYSEGSESATLAEKIKTFSVTGTDDFEKSRTLYLTMEVESGNRVYNVNYAIAARNEMSADLPVGALEVASGIFCDSSVVMVPGEEYVIPIEVTKPGSGIEATVDAGATITATELTGITVKVDEATTAERLKLKICTKDAPIAEAEVSINIRRVNKVDVSCTVDTSKVDPEMTGEKKDFTHEAIGAVYTCYADLDIYNSNKMYGYACDANYKNPRQVEWTEELTINGVTANVNDYFKVEKFGDNEKEKMPKATYEVINQDMPAGLELVVTAKSLHADGINKANSDYDDKSGSVTIKPRKTKAKTGMEVTIEPNETRGVALGTKGARPKAGDVVFEYYEYYGETEKKVYTPVAGTKAEYDPATDKVNITLGNDEAGAGMNALAPSVPYTFVVKAMINGGAESVITVHVRRVDYVHIDPVLNKDDNQTMDLRLRFNADKKDDNLIKYLIDGAETNDAGNLLNKALSVRVTIEVLDKNGNARSGLTQIAEWGTYAADKRDKNKENNNEEIIKLIQGKWRTQLRVDQSGNEISDKDYKNTKSEAYKNSKVIYQLENTKPARIKGADKNWTLEQTPELDIKPLALGKGEKIKVTMEALHPTGNNIMKTQYKSGVQDVYILDGQEVINVAKQNIVVEPYQVKGSGKGEMVIPVYLAPSVGAIKVKLEGNEKSQHGAAVTKVTESDNVGAAENGDGWIIVRPANGQNFINLGLDISRSEEGAEYDGKKGRIRMTLEAYTDNKLSEFLESTQVYLEVRRVTQVEISKESKENFKNEAGKEIQLTALASGLQGTEYFDRQVKESTDKFEPVWDQGEKYRSPYKLRWSLYYKENGKEFEKAIDNNYSEYFSNVSTSEDDKGNQTIKFTLNKILPNNWEIRATSEHAGNKEGKADNRSGLNYVKDIDNYKKAYPEGIVYDSIEISGKIIDPDDPYEDDNIEFLSGVKRGQDYFFSGDYYNEDPENANTQNANYERDTGLDHQNDCHWFWRVREITSIDGADMTFGPWTKYRKCKENSRTNKKLNAEETRTLQPDKRYQVELALLCISKNDKKMYWPYDPSVLSGGTGFEGYQQGWANKPVTPKNEYAQTFNIGRASIAFKPGTGTKEPTGYEELVKVNISNNSVWFENCYKTYGTFEHPLLLKGGDWFEVELAGYAIESSHYQHDTLARVQMLQGNTWVEIGATSICETIEDRKSRPLIKNIKGDAKGTYRISFKVDTYDIYYWDETSWDPVWEPQYRQSAQKQQYLICGSNGTAGYIHIRIE